MVSSTVEMHEQYGPELAIIGMNVLEEPAAVRRFVAEKGMTYFNLIADDTTLRAYQVRAHPVTVLIAPDGQIFRTYVGYTDKAALEQGVRELLGLE